MNQLEINNMVVLVVPGFWLHYDYGYSLVKQQLFTLMLYFSIQPNFLLKIINNHDFHMAAVLTLSFKVKFAVAGWKAESQSFPMKKLHQN